MSRPRRAALLGGLIVAFALLLVGLTEYESYSSLYDAEYVGSESCGECHLQIYPSWLRSPHANMLRPADPGSVVGDFDDATWALPQLTRRGGVDAAPFARMYREAGDFIMALRHPRSGEFIEFPIEYVVGYQYRQTYLTREPGGVLRRLPLQWSTERRAFFPYWNYQEGSPPTAADLWQQMTTLNSAWNLFCARCHTTKLTIHGRNAAHTRADTEWVDAGIACEACHGPGSQHVNYMAGNPVNRVVAWLNNRVRGQPAAYIANAPKLTKGQALSVCARCHGSDILRSRMDIYRLYEPGYSDDGRINDLSQFFTEAPLEPGRTAPTVGVWRDGRPKGIGMLFRSFVESDCYAGAEVRCYDCHDPHDNKQAAVPGILEPSPASNGYCLECHSPTLANAEHTRHPPGSAGSWCYDCHMPRHITNAATGVLRYVRTHTMSSIPDPRRSVQLGFAGAPNACNDCHRDRSAAWAAERMLQWRSAGESAARPGP